MKKDAAHQLAERIASGKYEAGELHLFLAYISTVEKEEAEGLVDTYLDGLDKYPDEKDYVRPDFLDRVIAALPEEIHKNDSAPAVTTHTLFFYRPAFRRMAVAVLVLLLLILPSLYFLFFRKAKDETPKGQEGDLNVPTVQIHTSPDSIPVKLLPRAPVVYTGPRGNEIDLDTNFSRVEEGSGGTTIYMGDKGNFCEFKNHLRRRPPVKKPTMLSQ